ncbi:MAG: P1 family peptidase [Clostridiaceae bacterium]|nr:P1 family peptidase [Clostridiaceae bacterium]
MKEVKLTDIKGIKVGHAQDEKAATGCTVILCEEGAVAGVDVRGGAPGTRETDLLNPVNLVEKIHAVFLTGGSAFGLDVGGGVMEYLEERNVGFDVGVTKVPIVTGAVLFDLTIGDYRIRPNKVMGYKACENASAGSFDEGTVGAGTGATVGKFLGGEYAMKGGLGSYCLKIGDLMVGAIVAVNCFGDVVDPKTANIVAGALNLDKKTFANTEEIMLRNHNRNKNPFSGNTTIGTIVTNGKLNKAQATKIASMAHNGYARTMRPAHTMVDGDTIFTMGTGEIEADINIIGTLASKVMEEAVIRGVKKAISLEGVKCYRDMS